MLNHYFFTLYIIFNLKVWFNASLHNMYVFIFINPLGRSICYTSTLIHLTHISYTLKLCNWHTLISKYNHSILMWNISYFLVLDIISKMLLSAFSDKTCKLSLENLMQSIIYAVSVSIQRKYMNTSNSFTNKSNVQYLQDMHFANPAEPSQRFLQGL